MRRYLVVFSCALALVAVAAIASGDSLLKQAAAEFRRSGAELDKIEEREGAQVAAGEIALARRWIEEGFQLLKGGHEQRAAVLAERLPVQLTLIRAVLAAREAENAADKEEREAHQLRKRMDLLQSRYDRLVLKYRGAQATDAFPRKKKDAE
jgi:hypothetical protein